MYDSIQDSKGYADQLNIETPEQVDLRFPIAGIGSRFLALITDSVIQGVTLFLLILAFVLMVSAFPRIPGGSASVESTAGKWFIAGMILFYFLL
jgi:uncharacterized RDD family membrane protein YckC